MNDTNMTSKVIPGEQIADIENWSIPDVQSNASVTRADHNPMTARRLETLHEQARSEGFAVGRREALEAGQREVTARVMELDGILGSLSRPLADLDDTVEQQLVTLATTLARHIVRREIRTDPGQVLAAVREALRILPVAARNVRLHLHPEDAALVRDTLSLTEGERTWELVEDPILSRGGCRVSSDSSHIDATVESRLNAVIAAVFGAGRESDRPLGDD
jgi:flagellar assembly protein FliH